VPSLTRLATRINEEHLAGESCLRQGLQHFRQAGKYLLQAKKQCQHGEWLPWLKKNVSFSRAAAYRYMLLAALPAEKFSRVRSLPLTEAIGQASAAAHVSRNSGVPEWYSPPDLVQAARAVLGRIDTDPASSDKAQLVVRAGRFYTLDDDGLSREWTGRVWLNPPYTPGIIEQFVDRLCDHVQAGNPAILLVNNATETKWFQRAARLAAALCFPQGRVRFLDEDGSPGTPLQGQAVLYFGDDVERFIKQFGPFGFCTSPNLPL
jgi:ParB family chromosome partitioning protein